MMPDVLPLFGSVGRQEKAVAAMGLVPSERNVAFTRAEWQVRPGHDRERAPQCNPGARPANRTTATRIATTSPRSTPRRRQEHRGLSELELASAAPLEASSGSAPQRFRNRRAKRTQTIRRCEPVRGRLQGCRGRRQRVASHRNIVIRALAWALRPPPRGYARIGLPAAPPDRDGTLRHCARPPPELSCVRARRGATDGVTWRKTTSARSDG
jgi:hypothetical protein